MNLVFVSNYMNHHQMPVSRELYRLCREQGGSYTFVQTQPMEQERVAMGWGESLAEADFVRNYWEDEIRCQESIDQADAVSIRDNSRLSENISHDQVGALSPHTRQL